MSDHRAAALEEKINEVERCKEELPEHTSEQWGAIKQGYDSTFKWLNTPSDSSPRPTSNALREFFESRKQGLGIWKWDHYFEIYDRHFSRFRGEEVHVLEIGIYSGGSLEMWRDYFGPKAHIYGVDIEPACRAYETENIKIFIGDRADPLFWYNFRLNVPVLDIVIDDGGHQAQQQIVSIQELLPFLRPGGVYCCEDILGAFNWFASYVHGLSHRLNEVSRWRESPDNNEARIVCDCTPFQSAVASIHLYPFVSVIERNAFKITELRAPKHGSRWQPFLK